MTADFSLNRFIADQRLVLVGVFILTILESILYVSQYYLIGLSINGLLENSLSGIYWLTGVFTAKVIISFYKEKRGRVTYNKIYGQLIKETVAEPLDQGERLRELSPRNNIIYTIADFFRKDLIKGFSTIVRMILVLVMLVFMNWSVFLACIICGLILLLLFLIQRKKITALSEELAEELKQEHLVLEYRDTEYLYEYQMNLERLEDALSKIRRRFLLVVETTTFLLMLVALIMVVNADGHNAMGTFFALLYYVFTFSEGIYVLPPIYQNYMKVQKMSLKLS